MANNYTVSSLERPTGIIETPGDNVSNSTPTYILTLTPDAGYSITHSNFSAGSLPSEINSVTFAQNGELVVATVNFATNFVMPANNVNLQIDIDGSAQLKNYTISGTSINGTSLAFEQKNDKVYVVNMGLKLFKEHSLQIKYVGKPPVSKNPPWEAGIVWDKDSNGNHWVGIACQSKGAHIWFPSKSNPNDKVEGAKIKITVPKPLKVVSNGLLKSIEPADGFWQTWVWETNYPISSYNINFTIGDFNQIKRTGYLLDKPL